jgi:hypothetical protein
LVRGQSGELEAGGNHGARSRVLTPAAL